MSPLTVPTSMGLLALPSSGWRACGFPHAIVIIVVSATAAQGEEEDDARIRSIRMTNLGGSSKAA